MKNFWARVLLMAVIFPFLFVIIFLLPHFHHLLFNAAVTAVALIGTFEIRRMFEKKGMPVMRWIAPSAAASLPVAAYLEEIAVLPPGTFLFWLAAMLGVFFCVTVCVRKEDDLPGRLPLFASSVCVLLCPAFFLSFIVRITSFTHPHWALLYFLAAVFINDIFAYLAGMLARGKTRLNLPVSPNKSLIGFIAGFLGSLGMTSAFSFLLKDFYTISLPAALLLGAVLAFSTFLGDLFESALKRSCRIKDSGVIMAGRGGIMDAIDSLLLSAPCFLFFFQILAKPT